jgi:hypothetical protein
MATALCLMPDEPPAEPVVEIAAEIVAEPAIASVEPDPDPAFAMLRGRYQAVVHERDELRARLDRYERLDQMTLYCDKPACSSAYTYVGPAPAETRLLGLVISAGWTIVGGKHFCASCRP